MAAQQTLEIVLRYKDLLSKSLGTARLALVKFANVGGSALRGMTRAFGALRQAVFGLPGLIAGLATGAVSLLSRNMTQAASDAEETASRFRVSFGEMAGQAQVVAETIAGDVGRSVTQVQSSLADFGSLLTSVGFGEKEAVQASQALTQLSIDLGSFQNVSDERASNALRSALLGEAEALKQLNIFVTEGKVRAKAYELGIAEVGRELTDQQKIVARLAVIMESNTLAHGDAARTMDSFANSTKALKSQVQGLREEFGARLILVLQDVIKSIGGTAVILEVVRGGFEIVVAAATSFIQAGGKVIKIAKGVLDTMESQGGVLKYVGQVTDVLGKIFESVFSAGEVFVRGFEQGVDTLVLTLKSLWNVTQLLAGAFAFVVLELMQVGTTIVGRLAEGFRWLVKTLGMESGLTWVMKMAADGIKNLLIAMSKLFGFMANQAVGISDVMVDKFVKLSMTASGAAVDVAKFKWSLEKNPEAGLDALDAYIAKAKETGDQIQMLQGRVTTFMATQVEQLKGGAEQFTEDIMRDAEATMASVGKLTQDLVALGVESTELSGDLLNLINTFQAFEATGQLTTDQARLLAESLERLDAGLPNLIANMGTNLPQSIQQSQTQLQRFLEYSRNMQQQMDNFSVNTLQSFAGGLGNAFAQFATGVRSSKEAFADFARSFLAQVVQMISQMLILRAIASFFGGGAGAGVSMGKDFVGPLAPGTMYAMGGIAKGGLSNAVPVHGYAMGGPLFKSPHLALIGEGKYNEAVVPLPDGRSIPVDMRGNDAGTSSINFNIQMVDARGVDQLLTERRQTIEDVIASGMSSRRSFRSTMQGNVI